MWALHLRLPGSTVQAHQSWRMGLVAPRHVGSSQTRGWTCVSYIGSRFFTTETPVCVCVCVLSRLSRVQLFATPWTVACHAPLSMGFSRQEYWSGVPFPSPGDLHHPGMEPVSLTSPALAGRFFTTSATWEVLTPGKPSNFFFGCVIDVQNCNFQMYNIVIHNF